MEQQINFTSKQISSPNLKNGYIEVQCLWDRDWVGPYVIVGSFSHRVPSGSPAICRNAGLRDVSTAGFIQVVSWDIALPPTLGDFIDVWATGIQGGSGTLHNQVQLQQSDIDKGQIVVPNLWASPWTGQYNIMASFCYRSSNPPHPASSRTAVIDGGIGNQTSTGYNHIVKLNTVQKPNVGDWMDFWGVGQQQPSSPVLSVEVH